MAWLHITCKCKHTADFTEFCRTPIFGDLPKGHYQCPSCGLAWLRKESEHSILRHGSAATIVSGRVDLVPIEARL